QRWRRLDRCKIILNWLKKKPCLIKIFSDEKIFTVDQVYNRRNDRWLAKQRVSKESSGPRIPSKSDGKKMPPFFFRPDEKIDTEAYYKVLRYTQDGAPSHMAAKNQKFCKDNMAHFWPKNFWPPKTNRTPHLNLDSLKPPSSRTHYKCRKRFRPRLEAVVKANGGHIE
ncbi:Uncharacterized protein FKW44_000239, partial [Caligus rogercresseyi]